VQHLDIVEDLLDEDQMMATMMRQGWTLSLVFGVGQSDKDVTEKTKFGHEEAHSHELGVMVGLATQSVQGMGDISVWRHGRIWLKYGCNNKFTRVQHLGNFEVLVEVATTVVATTTNNETKSDHHKEGHGSLDIVNRVGKETSFHHCRQFGHTQLWAEGSVDGCTGCR
jgi:hypothetical protein